MYRSRREVICLDAALRHTDGSPAGWGLLRRRLRFDEESEMLVGDSQPKLVGQIRYAAGSPAARLTFVLPAGEAGSSGMTALLEALAAAAGTRGALRLLAEVDELSPAFESLRRAGFTVYAWQRIWAFAGTQAHTAGSAWRTLTSEDMIAVRGLYQALVPPLAQSAEAFMPRPGYGLVYRQGDDLMAYVSVTSGPEGVYLLPLIHPAVDKVNLLLGDLLQQPRFSGRPRYLSMRSYQAWLEPALCEFDGEVTPRQALLVKHLAAMLRQAIPARQAVLEQNWSRPVHTIEQG